MADLAADPPERVHTPAPWRNWAGNQRAEPRLDRTPRTTDDVAAAVTEAATRDLPVRMAGSGHSFTGAAVTEGMLLRPEALTKVRSLDRAAGSVTVEAGLSIAALNELLAQQGQALANMGDITAQTVAGAIQTGTHGTGRDSGGLHSQVAALELVLADGSVVRCSPEERPELFAAAQVGLGALGVVTSVTLRTVPAYLLHATEGPMPIDEVLEGLDELVTDNEHFEFYWFPHTSATLAKRNNRSEGPARPLPRFRRWLDDEFLSNTLFGQTNRLNRAVPATIPPVNRFAARALGSRTYIDAPDRVFASPRRVRFLEQEYAIPRDQAREAITEIRSLIRRGGWRISFPIEVRFTPGSDAWLAPDHARATAHIACHVYHRSPNDDYFAAVEEVMTAAGGRPHWGKLHSREAPYLGSVYPRFADFRALRDELDPERRFANPYLTRVLGE